MVESTVLTVDEAAAYLKVHYKTVYALIRSGRLKAAKVGRQYRIKEEDIENYLRQ
jgi:putative molybdopterin biosynthesis protein